MQVNFYIPAIVRQNPAIYNQKQHIKTHSQPKSDCVVFGAKPLLSQDGDKIFKKVVKSIDSSNLIGYGAEARVYKLEGNNYCARILKCTTPEEISTLKNSFTKNVTEQDKVNHIVAKFGDKISIMPIIEGTPLLDMRMNISEIVELSKNISAFPASSYNKLIRQVSDAYEKGMMFDCCSCNILVNLKNKIFTVIDFYKNSEDEYEAAKHVPYIFTGLINRYTQPEVSLKIAKNLVEGALEEFKPGVKPCCDIDKFDLPGLVRRMEELKFNGNEPQGYYNYCRVLRKSFKELEDLKSQELVGMDVSNKIEGKIKVINTIMRQLSED